jgi:hypothetical protein
MRTAPHAGTRRHDERSFAATGIATMDLFRPDHDLAVRIAVALLETLDDARILTGAGRRDAELRATTERARDLQARFAARVAQIGPTACEALSAVCAATGQIVARLDGCAGDRA